MVKPSLDNDNVKSGVSEWKFAAVTDVTLGLARILLQKVGRQVQGFEVLKGQLCERVQSVASPAKEFNNLRVAGPPGRSNFSQSIFEFFNFLARGFKFLIRLFPT